MDASSTVAANLPAVNPIWMIGAGCFGTSKPIVRKAIGKQAGDTVKVHLEERIEG
jgi:hypothetical protein